MLRTMQSAGVPHLDQAIANLVETVENQKAEPRGVTGWFKKKFSKKENGTKEERQDFKAVVTHPPEAELSTHKNGSPAPGFSSQPPMAPPQRTADDDIHKRRQDEDDALEREYMRRTAQNY